MYVIPYQTKLEWDDSGNKLPSPPSLSTQKELVDCSNTEGTPPLPTIEPVIYSAVVRKNGLSWPVIFAIFRSSPSTIQTKNKIKHYRYTKYCITNSDDLFCFANIFTVSFCSQ